MRSLFLILLLFCLNSCGFHLRGEFSLAPALHKLYLESKDPYGQLTRNLKQYLKMSGVQLTTTPEEANTVLTIISETETQNLISIDNSQLTRQYNLVLTVTYQITTPNGEVLVPPQAVAESRTLPIQSNQILAGSNEETTLYQQMRQAIVYAIVSHLSSNDVTSLLSKKNNETALPANHKTSH